MDKTGTGFDFSARKTRSKGKGDSAQPQPAIAAQEKESASSSEPEQRPAVPTPPSPANEPSALGKESAIVNNEVQTNTVTPAAEEEAPEEPAEEEPEEISEEAVEEEITESDDSDNDLNIQPIIESFSDSLGNSTTVSIAKENWDAEPSEETTVYIGDVITFKVITSDAENIEYKFYTTSMYDDQWNSSNEFIWNVTEEDFDAEIEMNYNELYDENGNRKSSQQLQRENESIYESFKNKGIFEGIKTLLTKFVKNQPVLWAM